MWRRPLVVEVSCQRPRVVQKMLPTQLVVRLPSALRIGALYIVPLENLEMFERMGVSFSYIILADAHFSHDTPRNSVVDLPVACFPRAREPGFTPSNRRAPQVCRKAPKIDRGRPPTVDLSVAPLARLALGVGHRQARNGRSLGIVPAFVCSGPGRCVAENLDDPSFQAKSEI